MLGTTTLLWCMEAPTAPETRQAHVILQPIAAAEGVIMTWAALALSRAACPLHCDVLPDSTGPTAVYCVLRCKSPFEDTMPV